MFVMAMTVCVRECMEIAGRIARSCEDLFLNM